MSVQNIPANVSGLNMRTLCNSNFTDLDGRATTQLADIVALTAGKAPKIVAYPEDFGAVHNGTTDDTAALQACIDSLAVSHGTVQLSVGTYKTTAALTIPSYVNIEGISNMDSVISSTSTTLDIIQVTGNAANCSSTSDGFWNSFRNFQVTRAAQATAGDGFHLVNTCYASFFQVYSFNSKNGFYLSGCGNTHLTSVYAGWTTATSIARNGIFIDSSVNSNASTIIDGHSVSNGGTTNGIGLLVSGESIADLFVYGFETASLDYGVAIRSTAGNSGGYFTVNSDIHLSKLIIDRIGINGVQVLNVNGGGVPCVQISDSHFQSASSGSIGVLVDTSSGVLVSGCQFLLSSSGSCNGIYATASSNCSFSGNSFQCCDYSVTVGSSSKSISVCSNAFSSIASAVAQNLITFNGTANYCIAIGNTLNGFATLGISLDTGTSHCVAYPNVIDPANMTPISNLGSNNVIS